MKITYYTFHGTTPTQSEGLKVAVSESRQSIWLCSSKTNFKFQNVTGVGQGKIFDSEAEMNKVLSMPADEFEATIIKTFVGLGYKFIKKQVDGE